MNLEYLLPDDLYKVFKRDEPSNNLIWNLIFQIVDQTECHKEYHLPKVNKLHRKGEGQLGFSLQKIITVATTSPQSKFPEAFKE
jgi:hypothetical protein